MQTYMKECRCLDYYDIGTTIDQCATVMSVLLEEIEDELNAVIEILKKYELDGYLERIRQIFPGLYLATHKMYELAEDCRLSEEAGGGYYKWIIWKGA